MGECFACFMLTNHCKFLIDDMVMMIMRLSVTTLLVVRLRGFQGLSEMKHTSSCIELINRKASEDPFS